MPAISVGMELRSAVGGSVDNLYVTPSGHLIVGETKLYRNPEARREVIGQIIDYAKDLSAFSYSNPNEAISKADRPDGERGRSSLGLYESVVAALGAGAPPEEEVVMERESGAVGTRSTHDLYSEASARNVTLTSAIS